MKKITHSSKTIGVVLHSVPKYSETFFRNKIDGLTKEGFKVILFVSQEERNKRPYNVVTSPDFSGRRYIRYFNSFLGLLKVFLLYPRKGHKLYSLDKKDGLSFNNRIRNLIINQHFFTYKLDWLHFGFGTLVSHRENVAEAIGAKMGVSFRGYDLYLSPLKHKGFYDILFLKKIQYHVLCNEMKQTLSEYNVNASNIRVITPAIDIDLFKKDTQVGDSSEINLITVARLHWKKGLEYTLEALSILKKEGVNFKYTIIGEGVEKERLIFAAYQLGILNDVIFAGRLTQLEIKSHLASADVYLQYSIQEGFCNAVLEAQAMELLCIVSNAEGLSENVIDGQTGWVIEKRMPKLLAQKIVSVVNLSDKEKRLIRQDAAQRVKNYFNLEKQQQEFCEFYAG